MIRPYNVCRYNCVFSFCLIKDGCNDSFIGVTMNLHDVSLFLVITETRSLTQAAKRQGISAMAVSRRLASLERELGTRLLQRTTRSVSLTQEGMEFLPYAQALIEAETGARHFFLRQHKGPQDYSESLRHQDSGAEIFCLSFLSYWQIIQS